MGFLKEVISDCFDLFRSCPAAPGPETEARFDPETDYFQEAANQAAYWRRVGGGRPAPADAEIYPLNPNR
jgi:hypothetical protein